MTFTFPLTEKRNVEELLKHLAQHKLSCPGNCVVVGENPCRPCIVLPYVRVGYCPYRVVTSKQMRQRHYAEICHSFSANCSMPMSAWRSSEESVTPRRRIPFPVGKTGFQQDANCLLDFVCRSERLTNRPGAGDLREVGVLDLECDGLTRDAVGLTVTPDLGD